ncbi:hypothetical protein, partial [Paenibacillus sp. EPM92]|uniref:hypothetical protein n=1 Tax=Paenibacillus sp. EPM92 TaxID=1561195 RepID=UPI001F179C54
GKYPSWIYEYHIVSVFFRFAVFSVHHISLYPQVTLALKALILAIKLPRPNLSTPAMVIATA